MQDLYEGNKRTHSLKVQLIFAAVACRFREVISDLKVMRGLNGISNS